MAARVFAATSGADRLGRLTMLGLLAVPLLIGGILTWAVSAPTQDIDRVTAAIVNDDVPVTVNETTIPLGRQFAAGLMGDESGAEPNFSWVLTNDDEAATGLRSGRYAAVVTIPSTFSAAATSMGGPAADARQAVIEVETTPASAFLDPALTQVVTAAAVSSLNEQLTAQYLGNVYAGFNTINAQIADAASGADSLAAGADSLASGAESLASGADQLAAGLGSLDTGADALASGLAELDAAAQGLPGETASLAQGAAGVAAAIDAAASALNGATAEFAAVVAQVCQTPGPVCDRASAALARLQDADQQVGRLAAGADAVASGNAQLAAAMPQLVAGIDSSAGGAAQVAAGADQANSGAQSLDAGAQSLASGAAQVDTGAAQLAAGLTEAVEQIPTYSDSDISTLSSVVSRPVLADQDPIAPGFQSVPLFTVLALWLGGLVIALAYRAVPTRRLLTAVPSRSIALRAVLPTAALGAGQGIVVAVAVLFGVSIGPAQWLSYAGASILIGAVFAVVNQGLAAAFGGVGRVIALLAALIALSEGLSSTVPPVIDALATALPTAPGLDLLLASLTEDPATAWPAFAALLLFAVLGIALVYAGIATRRAGRAALPDAG